MKQLWKVLVALAALGAVSILADTVAYTDPANQGNQAFPGNVALDFQVLSPTTVTALGAFNAVGNGLITGNIQVVIFDNTTHLEVTPVVTFHGSYVPAGLGFDVFQAIAPVILPPGSYQVDAVGFGAADLIGNINFGGSGPLLNGGGKLAFTDASFDQTTGSLDNPQTCLGCAFQPKVVSQFSAGTFEFIGAPTGVPEPSPYLPLMVVTAGVGFAAIIRRSRRLRHRSDG